jgi:phosphinothricin acetyltransferase
MPVDRVALEVRNALPADCARISEIYNYYVLNSTATFAVEAELLRTRMEWFEEHEREGLPIVVAECDGNVVAWGSLSYYHRRCAYRQTLEPSVYVDHNYVRRGFGKALTQRLIELARTRGDHVLVGLACSENKESIAMTEASGFQRVGVLKEVGRKFDRWLDVTILQMMLQ